MPEKFVVGIDEAGRGCVLGPLVIGAFAVAEGEEQMLKAAGAKDSKLLSASQREALREKLSAMGVGETIHIPATELDELMGKKISLNEIEAMKIGELLKKLQKKLSAKGGVIVKVFADSPDPGAVRFTGRISKYFKAAEGVIECSNHAEGKWPPVASASIFAKVERDAEIEKIKVVVKEDFGSGYSSDPRTIEFLKRRYAEGAVSKFVRHKWATVKNLQTAQLNLGKYV